MNPDDLEIHEPTLSLINAEISARLDRQSDSLGRIDTKAGLLLGYTIAAASFLSTRHFQPVLAGLAYACFAAAAVAGIAALAVWNYQDIKPATLIAYANASEAETLARLIARRTQIFEINNCRQRRKARVWWTSSAALVLGSALMVASILAQTSHHDRASQRGQRPIPAHTSNSASPGSSPR